jgi:triphosphoribosyl-dephospho-CoA synthase
MSAKKAQNLGLSPALRIAEAAQMACVLEVSALKPGNVNRLHDFPDLHFEDFLLSAVAIGPAMKSAARCSVGNIIWQAIRDTHLLVSTNTNLGIILLLTPLVKACSEYYRLAGPHGHIELETLQQQLSVVLANLTIEDARLAYRAIRHAVAGGLGRADEADVSEEPVITLLQAMALAQERDSVAREYVSGFQVTFAIGYPALQRTFLATHNLTQAIVQAFLTLLASMPDTLISRKRGDDVACQVSQWAADALARGGVLTPQGQAALEALDQKLRDEGHTLNPGTSADLTAAAIFLHLMLNTPA